MKMRSKIKHPWFAESMEPGSEFAATENEATMLETLGWAERIADEPRRTLRLNTRDMRAGNNGGAYETKAVE